MVTMRKYYPKKKFIRSKSIWALYKGEECVATGTFDDLERQFGYKRNTLFYYCSNYHRKLVEAGIANVSLVLLEKTKGKPNDLNKYNKRPKSTRVVKNPFAKYRVRNTKAIKYIQDNFITLSECKLEKDKNRIFELTVEDMQIILESLKGKKHE